MTKCVCPMAGFCELAKRQMNPRLHHLCAKREDYRRLLQHLPPQEKPKPEPKSPCIHRGEFLRQEPCHCGARDKQTDVFRCELQGGIEASAERWTSAQMKNEICRFCKSYEPGKP